MKNIGFVLKQARKARRLTLKDVSRETGISVSFLSDIERGETNPSIGTLETLTSYYSIELSIENLALDPESRILSSLDHALSITRSNKPGDLSQTDRRYDIVTTDLEKVIAYFKMYIMNRSE